MTEFQRNAFKAALAAGKLQIGLWSSLCQQHRRRDHFRFRLRLDPARHRTFAQRNPRSAVAAPGGAARHGDADRAPGLERRGAGQAHPRHRRADAAVSLCAERRRKRKRAVAATRYPPQGIRGVSVAAPRQPLRPRPGLSDQGQRRNLRAGAGRDRRRRCDAARSHRQGRRRRRRVHRPVRPGRLARPSRQSAARPTCRRRSRTPAAGSRRSASRPASSPATRRRPAAISTGAICSSRSAPMSAFCARNADALAKKFKG